MAWRLSWVQQKEVHTRDYKIEGDARSAALLLQMHCSKVVKCIGVHEVDAVESGPMPHSDRVGEPRILKFPRKEP